VFDAFDFDYSMSDTRNADAVKIVMSVFICPSDPKGSQPLMNRSAQPWNPETAMGLWYVGSMGPTVYDFPSPFCPNSDIGPDNYCGQGCNFGTEEGGFCEDMGLSGIRCFAGMIGRAHAGVAAKNVRDGLSHTFMVGETLPDHCRYNCLYCNNFPVAGTNIPLNQMERTNKPDGSVDSPYYRACGFKSLHTGGVHFAMADGSVQFISDSADYRLVNELGTRSGGEVAHLP
jgi:prepilin-type processing-associated H-X9-DG protein